LAVTLTAIPDTGKTFVGWSGGGCSGTGACVVTMNADTTVTALFSSSGGSGGCFIATAASCKCAEKFPGQIFAD